MGGISCSCSTPADFDATCGSSQSKPVRLTCARRDCQVRVLAGIAHDAMARNIHLGKFRRSPAGGLLYSKGKQLTLEVGKLLGQVIFGPTHRRSYHIATSDCVLDAYLDWSS